MKKSTLSQLNEYLFEELERLTNDDVEGDELKQEIDRSTAICGVAKTIIENASLVVKATRINAEYGRQDSMVGLIEMND